MKKFKSHIFIPLLLLLSPVSLGGDDAEDALKYFKKGKSLYVQGDYEQASQWLRKAISARAHDGKIKIESRPHYRWVEAQRGMQRQTIPGHSEYFQYNPNRLLADIKRGRQRVAEALLQSDANPKQKFASPPGLLINVQTIGKAKTVLEGNARRKLLVTVINKGGSSADDVTLHATSRAKGLQLPEPIRFKTIAAGEQRTEPLYIDTSRRLKTGKAEIGFVARERDGFDSEKLVYSLQTKAWQPPKLVIANAGVSRAGGRLLEASYTIINAGKGVARNVVARLKFGRGGNNSGYESRIILDDDRMERVIVGDLNPNQSKIVGFGFYTNYRIQPGDKLPLSVELVEAEPDNAVTEDLALIMPETSGGQIRPSHYAYGDSRDSGSHDGKVVDNVDINIPAGTTMNSDGVAISIGNGRYEDIDDVEYALQDARTVKAYMEKVMGYPKARLIENITSKDFSRLFGNRDADFKDGKLYKLVELASRKRQNPPVFIYYAGHGAPSLGENGKAYFVPVDTNMEYLKTEGYSLDDFYTSVSQLKTNNVTIVIDSCFSGSSGTGRLLYRGISPGMLKTAPTLVPASLGSISVFNSSRPGEVSYWYEEGGHSLFTYYFLKGLRGDGDTNGDGNITSRELLDYLSYEVELYVVENDKPSYQKPVYAGDDDKLLVSFK